MSFDSSSGLLATRLEDSPSTVWVWDVAAAELRAVLMFHGEVAVISWHPSLRESLLVRCEGGSYHGMVFFWDPLSEGPKPVEFCHHAPGAEAAACRPQYMWLGGGASQWPTVFCSDGNECSLATLCESDQDAPPWTEASNGEGGRQESPLELVPAPQGLGGPGTETGDDDSECGLEDTFHFKNTPA